jgi:hypothetical protein
VSPGGRGRPRERSSNRDRARGGLPAGRAGELVVTRQIRDRGDLAQLPHPDPGPLATVLDHQRAFPEGISDAIQAKGAPHDHLLGEPH